MGRICAFFGHRDVWTDMRIPLEQAIRKAIREHDVTEFWNGGYGAFDSQAAGAVKRVRAEFPQIQLIRVYAYLPSEDLPEGYDGSIYPEGLETVPQRFAISKRNEWMVQNCDLVIGYVLHEYGGAYQACRRAERIGKPIINLSGKELFHLP